MAIPRIPEPQSLAQFDKLIYELNREIVTRLTWLSHAFGPVEKMYRKDVTYPAAYAGKNIEGEYVSVLADEFFGSNEAILGFSYVDCQEQVNYDTANTRSKGILNSELSIVFWGNLKKILNDDTQYRNKNLFIEACLNAIKDSNRTMNGEILPIRWHTKPEDIYKGYSLKDTNQKFFIHPYIGVRFDCAITYLEQ